MGFNYLNLTSSCLKQYLCFMQNWLSNWTHEFEVRKRAYYRISEFKNMSDDSATSGTNQKITQLERFAPWSMGNVVYKMSRWLTYKYIYNFENLKEVNDL